MSHWKAGVLLALGLLGFIPAALADATLPTKDIKGAADNPLLPRYEGSFIVSYAQQKFTDFNLPLSPLEANGKLDSSNNNVFAPKTSKDLEGQLTRLVYVEPEDRSPLEVLRNYQDALTAAGGEVLWQCKDEDCGGSSTRSSSGGGGDTSLTMHFFSEKDLKDEAFSNGACAATSRITDQRYFSGRLPGTSGDTFLAVQTYTIPDGAPYCGAFNNRTIAIVHILEPKAREQKMVVVRAEEMAKDINASGHVALYGILFDTDKATLKPDSEPTLTEIAKLLSDNPDLKVVIVGHTDNVGAFDYNIDLSKKRAAAVVGALTKRFQVPADRMKSAGVGMVAPVATNASDDGRAKNRRVEVVRLN
ncbi:MAG: oprF 3 [Proteobacteria bacterium]|nr:oprF 3 [Pseudomonadota bacterium]